MAGTKKWLLLLAAVFLSVLLLTGFNYEDLEATLPSKIVDKDGELITRLDREHRREIISIDEVPEYVIYAFVAIEDARFFEHRGVDFRGIGRAAVSNFRETGNPFRGSQGGSTITQQLVKNTLLSPQRSLIRKAHEALLALRLERKYSKEEILELYLNYATYFHHRNYGVEAASKFYFNKVARELTLEEGALLAGIIQHPSRFSPHENPEQSKARQETVLQAMKEEGYITESEYRGAAARELKDMLAPVPVKELVFPHFVDYVIYEEAMPILRNMLDSRVLTGNVEDAEKLLYFHGLTIHTTMDRELQGYAEQVINNRSNYPATWEDENGVIQPQGALVVSEPGTGRIKALVGGRDYGYHNMVNRVTSLRSPGSALKPIIAYAPAMEEGFISPASVVEDAPKSWKMNGKEYEPKNFTGDYSGLTTVRNSLVRSLNIPAVIVYNDMLERETGFNYANKFGINTLDESDRHNPAAALGGLLKGVKPVELTEAYGTLANEGIRVKHHTITKIEDRRGNILYEFKPEPVAVVSPETAWLVTDILKDTATRGTAASLNLNFPAAAKTGTSQDLRDAWLIAYTPELVTTFWLGYDWGNIPVESRTRYTTAVVRDIIRHALAGRPTPDFEKPEGIEGPIRVSSLSGLLPSPHTPPAYIISDYFRKDLVPTRVCSYYDRRYIPLPGENDEEDEEEEQEEETIEEGMEEKEKEKKPDSEKEKEEEKKKDIKPGDKEKRKEENEEEIPAGEVNEDSPSSSIPENSSSEEEN